MSEPKRGPGADGTTGRRLRITAQEKDEAALPHYYLHLFNGEILRDEAGESFADEGAARTGAIRAISELIAEHIVAGEPVDLAHRIEVEDEQGEIVETIRFGVFFRDIPDT